MNVPRHPLARRATGFTLIELLTVIAIIGILAAIIIPVTGRVRASARSAKCASNLRQCAQAMLLYASNDAKGRLPYQSPSTTQVDNALLSTNTTENWIRAIAPLLSVTNRLQVEQTLHCPNVDPPAVEGAPYTFAMNGNAANNLPLTRITTPSQFPLLRHTQRTNAAITVLGDNNLFAFNDGGGQYNCAFADGHVARTATLIPFAQWSP